jgi:hypothetical protein
MKVKIKNRKNYEKKKKKLKVNLILTHVDHTFLILDPSIGPQAFRHTHYTLGKDVCFNGKKGPIQGSIRFILGPC